MINHFTFSAILACVSTLLAACYFIPQKSALTRLFGIYWLVMSWWSFTVGFQFKILKWASPFVWGWLLHLGCVFIPCLFFHFAVVWSGYHREKTGWIKAAYIISITYMVVNATSRLFTYGTEYRDFYNYPKPSTLYPIYFISFVAMIVLGTFLMIKPKNPIKHESKKWFYIFLIFHILAYIGGMDNFFIMADIRIFPLYPYGLYPIAPYAIIGSYALKRIGIQ